MGIIILYENKEERSTCFNPIKIKVFIVVRFVKKNKNFCTPSSVDNVVLYRYIDPK